MIREMVIELAAAIAAGCRRAASHGGLLLVTYALQLLVSLIPAGVVFALLSADLATEPALERAVGGDLASALTVLEAADSVPLAVIATALLAAAVYIAISWFVTAGLIGVYREQPEGRGPTARCFGAHGARRTLGFARLFALVAPLYVALMAWAGLELGALGDRLVEMISPGDLIAALAAALAGPALLLWILWTAVDHARVELVADPELAAWRALARAARRVLTRPVCLVHTGAGHLAAAALAGLYLTIAGFGLGAAALLLLRQLHALARHAVALAVLAGQTELADRLRR